MQPVVLLLQQIWFFIILLPLFYFFNVCNLMLSSRVCLKQHNAALPLLDQVVISDAFNFIIGRELSDDLSARPWQDSL